MKLTAEYLDQKLNGQKMVKKIKIFLKPRKMNYTYKLITQIEANGKIVKEQSTIANVLKKINVKNPEYDNSMNYFFKNSNMKIFTQDEARFCEQSITENEILNSLKNLHNQKTPGTDRLPADFYKFFWIDIEKPSDEQYFICN